MATWFAPSLQFAPLSVLYCQVAPASKPEISILLMLVMPSVLLAPLSVVRARVGACGARVSILTLGVVPAPPVLPAASV